MNICEMRKQLRIAAISVVMAAVALGSATYAWFVTNSTVKATTGSISAQTNGMVLQIVSGDTPNHEDNREALTTASAVGNQISPSSTDDAKSWFVPATWSNTKVSSYKEANTDEKGLYSQSNNSYYAFAVGNYTVYTVKETGRADVYLNPDRPLVVTPSAGASENWFNKIKGSLRVGVVVGDDLKFVYAPTQPSSTKTGNDVNATMGWSCVASAGDTTQEASYMHLYADNLVDQQNGNWAAAKNGSLYDRPAGQNGKAIATNVGYSGTRIKVIIWMEGTDSDCVNVSDLDDAQKANPTFNVTLNLVGVATE